MLPLAVPFVILCQISPVQAVATFSGVLKSIDRKFITIGVEDGQTMRMYVTRGTRFFREGRPAQARDMHEGDSVSVNAERDVRMNLLAVRVDAVNPKAQAAR